MASWTPRRPSPGLKERIFRPSVRPGDSPGCRAPRPLILPWLAPVTGGAFLLTLAMMQPVTRLGTVAAIAAEAGEAGFAPSAVFAALQSAPSHSVANNLVVASFTWTNRAAPPSTNLSFRGDAAPF